MQRTVKISMQVTKVCKVDEKYFNPTNYSDCEFSSLDLNYNDYCAYEIDNALEDAWKASHNTEKLNILAVRDENDRIIDINYEVQ